MEETGFPAALSPALTLPGGVALSDRGELYFTDFLTNRICRRTPCGEYSVIKGIDCEKPYGLCLQGDEVYLTDNARGRILCYSQAREKYDVLFERGEGWRPIALAASSDGWAAYQHGAHPVASISVTGQMGAGSRRVGLA